MFGMINGTNIVQNLFLTWVQPLLSFGSKNTIEVDSMPQLPKQY
jgi:hypothetical protein